MPSQNQYGSRFLYWRVRHGIRPDADVRPPAAPRIERGIFVSPSQPTHLTLVRASPIEPSIVPGAVSVAVRFT